MEQRDHELLHAFVSQNSQAAFENLVNRHLHAVYNVALRNAGPVHAEDVTQAVFILLARKAPSLLNLRTLGGWLHRVTRDAASDALRRARRRTTHERRAAQRHAPESLPDESHAAPQIDHALSLLRTSDREILVLRFFQDASYVDIAAVIGISEEAARKRTTRALTRLKRLLPALGAVTIAAGLSAASATPVPAALPGSILDQTIGTAGLAGKAALLASHVQSLMRLRSLKMAVALSTACLLITAFCGLCLDYAVSRRAAAQVNPLIPAEESRPNPPISTPGDNLACVPRSFKSPTPPRKAEPTSETPSLDLCCQTLSPKRPVTNLNPS